MSFVSFADHLDCVKLWISWIPERVYQLQI